MYEMRTPRLTIRTMRTTDAAAMAGYRNLPEVAAMQLWDLPYTVDMAASMLAEQDSFDGPTPGEWVQLAVEHDGQVVGDLVCNIRDGGGVAEIGYTLHPDHQGKGYASEAAAALVADLVQHHGIHRVVAELDPDNIASMRVLEAVGLQFEFRSTRSFRWRGQWVDNLHYAMTDDQWREWVDRPRGRPAAVELVEIDDATSGAFSRLRTHHSQERLVAPMLHSFRNALFPEVIDGAPVVPWMRGVLADGQRAGFVMLAQVTDAHPDPYLWRLLIDRMHQRRGIGEMVVAQVVQQLRVQGCPRLLTSWVEGPGSPRRFYERLGFRTTGNVVDGETEGVLDLTG